MNTKRPIVEFFGMHLPEYQFIGEKRPNLVFQHRQSSGIYRTFIVLRASQPHCRLAYDALELPSA